MLEQLLTEIRNWFRVRDASDGKHSGTFTIESGSITLPFLQKNQYFRVLGSVFNDGLHQYGENMDLKDETFEGTVWALAIPKAVIDLAGEIETWMSKYQGAAETPYTSESFAGYSYTKSTGGNATGGGSGWQDIFRARLNKWRKLREDL